MALFLIIILLLALAAFGVWWWMRSQRQPKGRSRDDRYTAEIAITPAQMRLRDYLQEAFPGQAVLYNQPLSCLVSVRHADDRRRAQQRLRDYAVDFVVCDISGKPQFAFQVDMYRAASEAAAVQREAGIKHRILATAGVRLLRLKRAVRDLPMPEDFRQLLLGAGAPDEAAQTDRAPLQSDKAPDSTPPDSESMSVTNLMGLAQMRDSGAQQPQKQAARR